MNCEKVNRLMNDFHDGATDAVTRIGMEKHLNGCLSCSGDFDRLRALSDLLQRDVAPLPTAALDRKLMQAFKAKHKPAKKSPVWWRAIFAGSVSVPKPAFAAALVAVALAVTTANLIGRSAAVSSGANPASSAPVAVAQPPSPEVIEKTQIVEVPVIKERVVTKTVYVKRENGEVQKASRKSLESNSAQTAVFNKKPDNEKNFSRPNLQMSGSVAENGYFTRTDLSDFEPIAEAKIRIIKKEKTDEK